VGSAQRGGSRSKSSSSSSSRSSHYGSYYHTSTSHRNENCTTINGTTTCTYVEAEPLSWTAILIFVAIFAGLLVVGIISARKDEERRKTAIDAVMKEYDAKMEEWPSQLD
jgi:hypothetical protein